MIKCFINIYATIVLDIGAMWHVQVCEFWLNGSLSTCCMFSEIFIIVSKLKLFLADRTDVASTFGTASMDVLKYSNPIELDPQISRIFQ